MYTIYNETKRPLKLNTSTVDGTSVFQISIGDDADQFTDKYDITTITNKDLAGVMTSFCEKCHDVVNKTSRFHFREPNKQVVVYDYKTCEVRTFDKTTTAEDDPIRKMSRNCVILVLDKNSTVKVFPKIVAGKFPAKKIDIDDIGISIIVFFVRMNNWANIHSDKPVYIYVDGIDGKKQIRLGYVKIGKNKEFTSNALIEETFEGEEFPEAPVNKYHGRSNRNYHRDNNIESSSNNMDQSQFMKGDDGNFKPKNDRHRNFNNRNSYHAYDDDYDNNMRSDGHKRGNPHRSKKRRHGREE